MTPPASGRIIRPRRKRRRGAPKWIWGALVGVLCAALLVGIFWGIDRLEQLSRPRRLAGYVDSVAVLEDEYRKFYGDVLDSRAATRQLFAQAASEVGQGDYHRALVSLQDVKRDAATPSVFVDIGLIYLHLGDERNATEAFRDALARDPSYREPAGAPKELTPILTRVRAAVMRESEPNETREQGNRIPVGVAIAGEIADRFDVDFFEVLTPPAPRDVIAFELTNQSKTLEPVMRVFDADNRIVENGEIGGTPGASVRIEVALPPNRVVYVQVAGANHSTGSYSFRVSPMHAFDPHEPNDSPATATSVSPGTTTWANIMDGADTDYYWVESASATTLNVDVRSQTPALKPLVQFLAPDNTPIAVRQSGGGANSLTYQFTVQALQRYYIRVSSQDKTKGGYSLRVE